MRTWKMWAQRYTRSDGGIEDYIHFGTRRYAEVHGNIPDRTAPVEVELTEDPDGKYWGWLDNGRDTPCMIWPAFEPFQACFANGYSTAEERGYGKHVRMSVKEVEKPKFILEEPRG